MKRRPGSPSCCAWWRSGSERIRVCRNGKPVAEIGPITPTEGDPLQPDPLLAGVVFHEDPVAPLAEEDWPDS